ncbi:uncharacterized protein FN964_005584 [Alca torda]
MERVTNFRKVQEANGDPGDISQRLLEHHRMVEVGRDFWRSSDPTPLLKQSQLEPVAQEQVQKTLEYQQEWHLLQDFHLHLTMQFWGLLWCPVVLGGRLFTFPRLQKYNGPESATGHFKPNVPSQGRTKKSWTTVWICSVRTLTSWHFFPWQVMSSAQVGMCNLHKASKKHLTPYLEILVR